MNQGPFKNDSMWNDEILQKLAVTGLDTSPGQQPTNNALNQTMQQSNSASLSGGPPAGSSQSAGQNRYPGEQIQNPAQPEADSTQQSNLANLGLAAPGQDQMPTTPVQTQARDIKTKFEQLTQSMPQIEILLISDKGSGGYKVGIKRLADDTGKPQFEMIDPVKWRQGTKQVQDKIDKIMESHGFIYTGDTEDRFQLYKRREDVANESQIKVQKGGKK